MSCSDGCRRTRFRVCVNGLLERGGALINFQSMDSELKEVAGIAYITGRAGRPRLGRLPQGPLGHPSIGSLLQRPQPSSRIRVRQQGKWAVQGYSLIRGGTHPPGNRVFAGSTRTFGEVDMKKGLGANSQPRTPHVSHHWKSLAGSSQTPTSPKSQPLPSCPPQAGS